MRFSVLEQDYREGTMQHLSGDKFLRIHDEKAPEKLPEVPIYHYGKHETNFRGTLCPGADKNHIETLAPTSPDYRNGFLVFIGKEKHFIGHIKQYGKPTFLAWKNTKDEEGYLATQFAGLYHIHNHLYEIINEAASPPIKQWGRIHIPELALSPNRTLRESDNIFFQRLTNRQMIRNEYLRINTEANAISDYILDLE